MPAYPVQLEVSTPPRYDRIQLLLRLVISLSLGWLGATGGGLVWLLYLALPAFVAVIVSTRGAGHYTVDSGPRLWRVISWLLGFWAYMLLLVDRFPVDREPPIDVTLRSTGHVSVHSALLRLVTSIPSAFVLAILSFVSCILVVVGMITIAIDETIPAGIQAYQRGFLRWTARLLAYHASLVDEYPPFSFEATHGPTEVRAAS